MAMGKNSLTPPAAGLGADCQTSRIRLAAAMIRFVVGTFQLTDTFVSMVTPYPKTND
jgi:hypothetical protein